MQPTIVVIVFPVNAIILVAAQLFVKHPLSQMLVKNPVIYLDLLGLLGGRARARTWDPLIKIFPN
jgi:hypothetical protein